MQTVTVVLMRAALEKEAGMGASGAQRRPLCQASDSPNNVNGQSSTTQTTQSSVINLAESSCSSLLSDLIQNLAWESAMSPAAACGALSARCASLDAFVASANGHVKTLEIWGILSQITTKHNMTS